MTRSAKFLAVFFAGAALIVLSTLSSHENTRQGHNLDCAVLGFSVLGGCR